MKSRNNKISVVLVVLSLIYVIYLTYISNNNLLVGATVSKGKNGDIVITNVDEFSMASYSGIEKGDIVKRINNKKINTNEIKMNKLKNVSSMIVERNGHNLELKMTLFNDKNFTTYLIPLIFYIVCLFCCFFILKINESKNLLSAVVLIIFLLSASIAFISAGGSAKGDMLSRLIMVVTLISVPLNYLLFLYQYFKELGTKLFNKKVFILYLIPVINVVCEIFRSHLFFRDYVPKLNLLAFFFLFIIVGVYFSIILIKNKDTEQAHIIKVLTIINIFSFSPFLCLYLIPYVFLNAHYVSSFLAASFMLLIPFSLVFQFMTNKIYNVDFILSRLRYYGF